MNIENIISLVYLDKFKNFQKAADALFITQPTFSSRIKSLEKDLGCDLVNRGGRQLTFTTKGEVFLGHAKQIFEVYLAALDSIKDTRDTLAIGSIKSAAPALLSSALYWLEQKSPGTKASVAVDRSSSLIASVLSGQCDLAIVEGSSHHGLASVPIMEDSIELYAPPFHPLALRERPLALGEAAQIKNLWRDSQSSTWKKVDSFFASNGLRLAPSNDIDNYEDLKMAIINGNAVGFLPLLSVSLEVCQGLLAKLPLESFTLSRTLSAVFLEDANNPIAETLAKHLGAPFGA
ncbi:MAG: LysR family transcriptional regulator [Eubacteriaceae bacterium]|nr:LysR family transcriptional regulator [Eubacteriaceae bacterium]